MFDFICPNGHAMRLRVAENVQTIECALCKQPAKRVGADIPADNQLAPIVCSGAIPSWAHYENMLFAQIEKERSK